MKKTLLALTVVAALAAAFIAGRLSSPEAGNDFGGVPSLERVEVVVRDAPVASESDDGVAAGGEVSRTGEPAIVSPDQAARVETIRQALVEAVETRSPFVRTLKLYAVAQDIPIAELPVVLESLENHPEKRVSDAAQWALIERWAEASPRAALQWAQSRKEESSPQLIYKVLNVWSSLNDEAAMAAAAGLENPKQRQTAVRNVINSVSGRDYRRAYQLLTKYPDASPERWRYNSVFSNWAREDPQAAYQVASGLEDSEARRDALRRVVGIWAEKEPDVALEVVLQSPDRQTRQSMLQGILYEMAKDEPLRALEIYHGLPAGEAGEWALGSIYRRWGESDPQAAIEHVSANVRNLSLRQQASSSIVQSWYGQDEAAALAWLEAMPDSGLKGEIYEGLVYSAAQNGKLDKAYDLLELMPLGNRRNWAMQNVAQSLAREDPQAALAFMMANTSGQARQNLSRSLIFQLAENDPQMAIRLVDQSPLGEGRRNMIWSLANSWSRYDPEAALDWAQSLKNPGEREQALSAYYNRLASDDPVAAAEVALQIEKGQVQTDLVRNIAYNWSRYEPEATLDWASGIEEGEMRASAVQAAIRTWGESDPQAAADWVIRQPKGDERNSQIKELASAWAQSDPASTAVWIENLPEGDLYNDAQRDLVQTWLRADLAAAATYMTDMPPGDNRDSAIRSLVQQVGQYEPGYAAEWSLRVKNDSQRKQLLERSLKEWGKQNKFAARQFVISNGFSAEEREQLMKAIE